MKEGRLIWFMHVKRRCTYVLVRKCERLVIVDMRRSRGRPRCIIGRGD